MKRITKKQSREFNKAATDLLIQMGAEPANRLSYNLSINTHIGKLFLHVDDDNGTCYSVCGNFLDNTEEAKKEHGHWKYNFHQSGELKDIMQSLKFHISRAI